MSHLSTQWHWQFDTISGCIFTTLDLESPLITAIHESMFYNCNPCSLLSFHTTCYVLLNCACLQNVAFPPDAVIGDDIFIDKEAPMYGSSGAVFHHSNATITIMWEIWHQFDELVVRTTYPQLCLLPVLSSGGVTYPHCCNKHEIQPVSDITQEAESNGQSTRLSWYNASAYSDVLVCTCTWSGGVPPNSWELSCKSNYPR